MFFFRVVNHNKYDYIRGDGAIHPNLLPLRGFAGRLFPACPQARVFRMHICEREVAC